MIDQRRSIESIRMYRRAGRYRCRCSERCIVPATRDTALKSFTQIRHARLSRQLFIIRDYLALPVTDGRILSAGSTMGTIPPGVYHPCPSYVPGGKRVKNARKVEASSRSISSHRASCLPLMFQRAADAASPSAWDSARFPEPFS